LTGFVVAVTRPVARAALLDPPSDPARLVPEAQLVDVFAVEAGPSSCR
jgi:hypothetical protein